MQLPFHIPDIDQQLAKMDPTSRAYWTREIDYQQARKQFGIKRSSRAEWCDHIAPLNTRTPCQACEREITAVTISNIHDLAMHARCESCAVEYDLELRHRNTPPSQGESDKKTSTNQSKNRKPNSKNRLKKTSRNG